MGFAILPWTLGDEERFEVFTITSDAKWTPCRYLDDSDPSNRSILPVNHKDDEVFQVALEVLQDSSSTVFHDAQADLCPLKSPHIAQSRGDSILSPNFETLSNVLDFSDKLDPNPKPHYFHASTVDPPSSDKGSISPVKGSNLSVKRS